MSWWLSESSIVCGVKDDLPEGSFMLAGYLNSATGKQIEQYVQSLGARAKETFGPEYYHVSLRNWEGAQSLLEPFISWLRENEGMFPMSMKCAPSGLEVLGPSHSLVVLLRCGPIRQLQSRVDSAMKSLGFPPSKFPQFLPHISIAEGVNEVPDVFPDFPVVIDGFQLVDKHDHVYWRSD